MQRIPALALSAVLLPAALILGACSSSAKTITSGNTSSPSATPSSTPTSTQPAAPSTNNVGLTTAQLNSAIDGALPSVNAALVKGTIVNAGNTISLDVQFNKDSAGGTIGEGNTHITFVSVSGTTYVKMTPSLIAQAGSNVPAAVKQLLLNKWLSSNTTLGKSFATSIAPFSSIDAFTKELGQNNGDVFTAEGTTTLNGTSVAKYKDVSPTDGTTVIYLPAKGLALPIKQVGSGTNAGSITYIWNQPAPVKAPSASEIYSGPGAG